MAAAVVATARDQGVGRPVRDEDVERVVRKAMWEPRYLPYDPAPSA
jgi:hypothetical protein